MLAIVSVVNINASVAELGQVTAHQQQIGPVRAVDQPLQHRLQALHIVLIRVAPVEADMDVGNLRDPHFFVPPPAFGPFPRGGQLLSGLPLIGASALG